MKQIFIFETPEELATAFKTYRSAGDESPILPHQIYIVIDNDYKSIHLSGELSENFEIDVNVKVEDLIKYVFEQLNIRVHIT